MKAVFEFRSFMSRGELRRALQLTLESTVRLSPRMTDADLACVENAAAAIAAAVEDERRRRAGSRLPPPRPAGPAIEIDRQPLPQFLTRSPGVRSL